ncbi:MAG: flagellar basal body-associated FliL family protein [Lentisphaeraceae bacterium]|nr:flagellar basal body-associated FliL family protein [Lentisphaeraceae bacterium]
MADEEKKDGEGEEIVVKKSGNSHIMIMMVLCIAVILLTPFAVIYTLRIFDGAEQEKISDVEPEDYQEVTLDEISVNISRSSGQHIVLVELTLHLTKGPKMKALFEDPADGVKSLKKVFQANIIDILRTKVMEDLEGSASVKKKLEKDIMLTLNSVKNELAPEIQGQVMRVFFSRYILQ